MSISIGPSKKNGAAILSRALELKDGNLPPAGARFILNLGIKELGPGSKRGLGPLPERSVGCFAQRCLTPFSTRPESDKKQFLNLLAKNQKGQITAEELDDLESYVQPDNILSILKAHAALALKRAGQEP